MLSLSYSTRLLLAVLLWLGLYVMGTNLAWWLRTEKPGKIGRVLKFCKNWSVRLYLGEALRVLFHLGPPYLVLLGGWASPADLGLVGHDWISGIGYAAGIGVGALALMIAVWGQRAHLLGRGDPTRKPMWVQQAQDGWLVLSDAILLEVGWAFCRAPFVIMAGGYWGPYVALLTVALAGALNAGTRAALDQQGTREEIVLTASVAVVSTTLYIFAQNLWLNIGVHLLLGLGVLGLQRRFDKNAPLAVSGQ